MRYASSSLRVQTTSPAAPSQWMGGGSTTNRTGLCQVKTCTRDYTTVNVITNFLVLAIATTIHVCPYSYHYCASGCVLIFFFGSIISAATKKFLFFLLLSVWSTMTLYYRISCMCLLPSNRSMILPVSSTDHKGFPLELKTEFAMPKEAEEDEEQLPKAKL